MRTPPPAGAGTALDPVRAQLLRAARAEADALLAAADDEAQAAAILAEARRLGEADAAAARDAARARSRRAARARELVTRRECWEELGRRVERGVGDLRRTDSYPGLRVRLTAYVRDALGPDARITEALGGGVVGEAAGRRLDCSLAAFARRALERTGTEAEELWAP
ncbi:hypothetical protein OG895_35215 [Streptomyces sp. NBC_00201]|uniref:hypothetical protein n=1 Tax=unclassified Streptomyces TaxID=2593676 RepID=UPI002259484F|nr:MULTISPECIES: hypothetical protein [unclassified Streptomyces]MCX5062720.1 hypothetical protein [Streptomyces sp. NBC_00452]MCX5250400.1 hypothetical protein [Streptomyces sp. NBC_00201]MCX5291673.1 hypothetical protein [Streptomyces sp. NBC_00183]